MKKFEKLLKNKIKLWLFNSENLWEIIYKELREISDSIIIELEEKEKKRMSGTGCWVKDKPEERHFVTIKLIEAINKVIEKKQEKKDGKTM